ncbi:putative surface antigen [Candidatus Ichthyocystis hellenicum]|uniref:Outer membrane protein assembly factor BamA n=2 Tax=Candidatus Ichthyocystis hellenicum TaxID=1561003 RepID=A0A0S4M1W8_9BURK|nr:putative surface antigen [Candidatus Ichthyocystis hellenicum]
MLWQICERWLKLFTVLLRCFCVVKNILMRKLLFVFCCLFLVFSSSEAAVSDHVNSISVRGLVRSQPKMVIDSLGIHPGDAWDDGRFSQAIHDLFKTGLYTDIRLLKASNNDLVVEVHESPTIASISFTGMDAFSDKAVKKSLSTIGIALGNLFDPSMLHRAVLELKQQYLFESMYATQVAAYTTPLENNRVAIQFVVRESNKARVRSIKLYGNNNFSREELLSYMSIQPTNLFSWYTKNDRYSDLKFDEDMNALTSFYYDRGFINFSVTSRQVSINPDLTDAFLKVVLDEGLVFHFGKFTFQGPLLTKESFEKMVNIRAGEVFSRKRLLGIVKKVTDFAANSGYLYAHVDVQPNVNSDSRVVDVNLVLHSGPLVLVRRIDIEGNTMTKDEVIRRELRQYEGAVYDLSKVNRSKERLNRLGYFYSVSLNTVPVLGSGDQVDIHIVVKERPTGQFRFSVGYSSAEKLVLELSVLHPNVFGTGDFASIRLNMGAVNKLIDLTYTDPYWTTNGVSRSLRFYRNSVDQRILGIANYRAVSTGARVRFGIPISEFDTVFTGIGVENIGLTIYNNSPRQFINFVRRYGPSNNVFTQDFSWSRDYRDSLIYPTRGSYDQISAEVSLPGSDLKYYNADYLHQTYFPVVGDRLVLLLHGHLAFGRGFDGFSLPFFKSFYAGGIGTVRGYASSTLGPHDSHGSALGGDTEVDGGVEFLFPIPGMGKDRSLRLAAFLDFGQVYGKGDYRLRYSSFRFRDIRYSSGLALSWLSPIGPLRFSYGYAINPAFDDQVQAFQFTIGAAF